MRSAAAREQAAARACEQLCAELTASKAREEAATREREQMRKQLQPEGRLHAERTEVVGPSGVRGGGQLIARFHKLQLDVSQRARDIELSAREDVRRGGA